MNKLFSLFAVSTAIVFLTVPALAQEVPATGMDVSAMTCGDFKKLDRFHMMAVTIQAMKMASMSDDEKAEMNAMDQEAIIKFKAQSEKAAIANVQKDENSKKMNDASTKLMAACGSAHSMMIMEAAKSVTKN